MVDRDELTSVSMKGINQHPLLLNLLPCETSSTNQTSSPHLISDDKLNPEKRPLQFPQTTRPIFSGHFGPISRSTNHYYEAGTSSRSNEKPTRLAQQPFIRQARFGHPGNSPHTSVTKDQSQLLTDLTPYQLQLLNQLARNAYPTNSTFNFHPLGSVKRPSGMMLNHRVDQQMQPKKKKPTVANQGRDRSISRTEFDTWKLYQERMREVAVEQAEKRVYDKLWNNIVRLQQKCAEYSDRVTNLEIKLMGRDEMIVRMKEAVELALRNNPPGVVPVLSVYQGNQGEAGNIDGSIVDRNGNVLAEMIVEFEQEHGEQQEMKADDGRDGEHPTPRE